jgi:hypothetical protein
VEVGSSRQNVVNSDSYDETGCNPVTAWVVDCLFSPKSTSQESRKCSDMYRTCQSASGVYRVRTIHSSTQNVYNIARQEGPWSSPVEYKALIKHD